MLTVRPRHVSATGVIRRTVTRDGGWEEAVASKKRERKSDRKRTKLEKRRRKLEMKLREVEEWLKKHPKPSKTATGSARKMKRRAKSGAARSVLKQAKRPVQKVEPAPQKTARKTPKPKPAANSGAARRAPKQVNRPLQRVKPTLKKTARKAPKPNPSAHSGSKSPGRLKRARRALSATRVTGTPKATASYSQETLPAEVSPASNTAPEMTSDLQPKQPT